MKSFIKYLSVKSSGFIQISDATDCWFAIEQRQNHAAAGEMWLIGAPRRGPKTYRNKNQKTRKELNIA